MGRIVVLPDTLCNQIAAGEVVERPAAVVKELVENSIDAGARKVSVSMLQGGRKEIRVVDNGMGMGPDDALLALERHATSKLHRVEELQSIQSLGFRGEALPSIAAVSRFELTTREPRALSATQIRVEGGVLRDVREAGSPPGTMITVRDLFFNVPARRKFLRTIDTETAHISEQFLRLAMAHPEIHFQLSSEERYQYDFPQTKTTLSRASQILGIDVTSKLREFSAKTPSISIEGFASPPEIQRSSGQSIFAYVNGRPVWDRTLSHAILSAYDALIPRGKFPMVVLFLRIQPELVDVNVHPTKREVRFRNPGEVIDTVRATIRKAMAVTPPPYIGKGDLPRPPVVRGPLSSPLIPYSREHQIPLREISKAGGEERALMRNGPEAPYPERGIEHPPAGAFEPPPPAGVEFEPEPRILFSSLPVLGQLANTYILLEASDGLVLIDQHAAHERIVFERLRHQSEVQRKEPGQRLTRSVVIELFPKEAATLRRWLPHMADLGFGIEAFGGNSFVIHSVPAVLSDYAPQALIGEMLETAHEDEKAPRLEIMAALAKTAACHSAIRAGQKLRSEEIRHLLEALDSTPIAATCPHGRPLWFKLTHAEIARMFHRT